MFPRNDDGSQEWAVGGWGGGGGGGGGGGYNEENGKLLKFL